MECIVREAAGQAITTGNYNTIIGGEGLYSNVGYKNTSLGYSTGYWDNTGNLGTYIGYKTANGNKFGNNNLMIGNYAGGKIGQVAVLVLWEIITFSLELEQDITILD